MSQIISVKETKNQTTRDLQGEYRDYLAYLERDRKSIVEWQTGLGRIADELEMRGARIPKTPQNLYRD